MILCVVNNFVRDFKSHGNVKEFSRSSTYHVSLLNDFPSSRRVLFDCFERSVIFCHARKIMSKRKQCTAKQPRAKKVKLSSPKTVSPWHHACPGHRPWDFFLVSGQVQLWAYACNVNVADRSSYQTCSSKLKHGDYEKSDFCCHWCERTTTCFRNMVACDQCFGPRWCQTDRCADQGRRCSSTRRA